MEPKVILYIVAGVLYFLYSMKKTSDEKKQKQQPQSQEQKPVSPPSTFGDVMREIKRQQQRVETKINPPKPVEQKRVNPKATVMEEMRQASMKEELAASDETARLERAQKERAIYHIKTEEEEKREAEDHAASFDLDIRQAILGSMILERKY